MAGLYCRGCGDELSVDEYGNDVCDVCVASGQVIEDFYFEEKEDE